jgi:hypothetical protein
LLQRAAAGSDRAVACAAWFELHDELGRHQMTSANNLGSDADESPLATPRAEDDFGFGARRDSFTAPAFVMEPAVEPFGARHQATTACER